MAMVREQDVFLALGPAVDFVATLLLESRRLCQHLSELAGPHPRSRCAPRLRARARAAGAADTAPGSMNDSPARPACQGDSGRRSWLLRLCAWPAPAAPCLQGAQRTLRALDARDAEDELAGAARARGPGARRSTGSSCGHRSRRWRSRGSSSLRVRGPAHVRRIGWCALLMVALQIYVSGSVESWTVAGAFGQRRFVALDDPADHRAGRVDCRRAARRVAAGARHGARRQRLVERGAHRGVRHRTDESAAARAEEECVRCVRDAAAAAAEPRLSVSPRSEILLPAETEH